MPYYTIVFLVLLVVFTTAQVAMIWSFLRELRRPAPRLIPDEDCPPAAIILCLRGGDPFLAQCLQRLLHQDYPNFIVKIIVDHESDPAMAIVQQVVDESSTDLVRIETLKSPSPRCSLKCSSLAQAVESLDGDVGVVALIDADTLAHPTWLRELATSLADDRNGAATGNRWYMPQLPTVGAMLRYAWNCAAIIQMHAHHIAWGGTLAIRRDVIDSLNLPSKWQRAFCEDTMLSSALHEAGLRLAFVPSLMMINRETCSVPGYYRWVCRQLMNARLYHPRWSAVLAHGVPTAVLPIAIGALCFFAATERDWMQVAIILGSSLAYVAVLILVLVMCEKSVRRLTAAKGECTRWLTPKALANLCIASPLLQLLYPVALVMAAITRRMQWRGITYRIGGSWDIEMLEYQPYQLFTDDHQESL